MTRFVYLSDTHFGASGLGYHPQKPYPERLPEIVGALSSWIGRDEGIDFVLHGGDLVDAGTRDLIGRAGGLFGLPVPTYLCLGNHDLSEKESLKRWLELGSPFFIGNSPEFVIETADCAIHVIPNQWGEIPYYWAGDSHPHPTFLPEQIAFFQQSRRELKGKVQILLTHSPVLGLHAEETGGNLKEAVFGMVGNDPDLRCVLGAHSHLDSRIECQGVNYVTCGALVETPFEFKLFEAGQGLLRMTTVSLAPFLPFGGRDATASRVPERRFDL